MASLAHAPLQSLGIDLCMGVFDSHPEDFLPGYSRLRHEVSDNPQSYPLLFAERSVDEFDLEDYVRRFARLLPTLQRVTIRILGLRGERRSVELENGEVKLERSAHPLLVLPSVVYVE